MNSLLQNKGVEWLTFGTNRADIHSEFEPDIETFLRNEFAENTTDLLKPHNIFIEYDSQNICQAIEFHKPNTLYFYGIDLFSLKPEQLRNYFDEKSNNKEVEGDTGIIYYDLGFGAFFMNNDIETIIIFSNEYW